MWRSTFKEDLEQMGVVLSKCIGCPYWLRMQSFLHCWHSPDILMSQT